MRSPSMWAKLCLLSFLCVGMAQAAESSKEGIKGLTVGGNFEGGFAWDFGTGLGETQWLVDNLDLKLNADISDHVHAVLENGIAVGNGTAPRVGSALNTSRYFSGKTLAGGGMQLSNLGAYLDFNWMGLRFAIGHMRTPLGMESVHARYDMHTYYYSMAYSAAQSLGWNYDLGLKLSLVDVIPGTFEVELLDGRATSNGAVAANAALVGTMSGGVPGAALGTGSPALAARYSYEWKSGDLAITPTASTYLGNWYGGPKNIGITAGVGVKSGMFFVDGEWVFTQSDFVPGGPAVAGTPSTGRIWSAYIEPGVDLGVAKVSLKGEYYKLRAAGTTAENNDINLGVAVSHDYAEKYRVRVTYSRMNFSRNLATESSNDFRLLFGTKF